MKSRLLVFAFSLVALVAASFAQEPDHGRGFVPSPFTKELKAASSAKHGDMLKKLAAAPLPAAYETPFQIPQQDQGSCGSCWDVSACRAASCAFVGAGTAKGDGSFVLSADTVMWCYSTGGCNGDDASTVMRILKKDGLPINADVGEYKATSRGPCNKTAKRYKIDDWGYADADGDGVATYEEIKVAVMKFGACVITVDAGALVNGDQVSTYRGRGTNHQIIVVGWQDSAGKAAEGKHVSTFGGAESVYHPSDAADYTGVLICVNQWGNWGYEHNGQKGFCKLAAFSDGRIAASGSTEVIWCKVDSVTPPPPPFVPPFKLFNSAGAELEGAYPDLTSAETAAHAAAENLKAVITIKDSAGKIADTVTPAPPKPATVTFTIPAYSFSVVVGRFGQTQTVTIPARTITAPVTPASSGCTDCAPVKIPTVPPKPVAVPKAAPVAAPQCSGGSCQPPRRFFRR